MIWYDNLDDEDESENLDDRNHLYFRKYWKNFIPDYGADDMFGP